MAKTTASEGVFRVIDVIGSSATSWEDATNFHDAGQHPES